MFKLFDTKEEEPQHFFELIEKGDYTTIMEKMEQGYKMSEVELNRFDKEVGNRIQSEGVIFLSDLYKEGFEISDEWLLRWTKTKKFVTNYNLPVYGCEYFKERLEKIAPDILNYYLYRMDNLSAGVSRSYKVGFIQAVEVLTSVRNYAKIIEHIETGISDKIFNDYVQKLKNLNSVIEANPTFYRDIGNSLRVSDCIKDLDVIMEKRGIAGYGIKAKIREDKTPKEKEFLIPHNIQDYIKRIYDNHEKCIDNQSYLKPETVNLLDKIKDEKVLVLINKFKEDEDKIYFLNELKKIDNAISSVLVGINKQKMSDTNKEYFLTRNKIK